VKAGNRDKRITFQRATTSQDDYGEEVSTWGTLGQQWAAVFWGRGSERRQAAMEQGSQAATFQVIANVKTRALTIEDRIIAENRVWDIQGIAPDMPKRGTIEISAIASAEPVTPGDVLGFEPVDGDGLSVIGGELRVDIEELPGV